MVSLVAVVTRLAAVVVAILVSGSVAQPIDAIQRDLQIVLPGATARQKFELAAAMRTLHVGAVDIALIEGGRTVWSRHFGEAAKNTILHDMRLKRSTTSGIIYDANYAGSTVSSSRFCSKALKYEIAFSELMAI